jgi:hypothetical protein
VQKQVEIHYHSDTEQVRSYALAVDEMPLRFHAGFSQADSDAGWKQVVAFDAGTDEEISNRKAESVAFHRRYWLDLAEKSLGTRVVVKGTHYTMHAISEGIGFGGRAYIVTWLDPNKPPTLCNLSAQGAVPAWMREGIPDNASSVQEQVGGVQSYMRGAC